MGITPVGITPVDITPVGITPVGITPVGITPAGFSPAAVVAAPAGGTHVLGPRTTQPPTELPWAIGLGGCCVHRKAPHRAAAEPFGTPLLFGLLRYYRLVADKPDSARAPITLGSAS